MLSKKIVKEFKKKLIDDDMTIKEWASRNKLDVDRFRGILFMKVVPNEKEIHMIQSYIATPEG